ncbi:hypothetical protein [Streptomyces sp. NPDC102487]|uniref:hypothetical protein n=1 Tax=Streptomyces sp. NPDC102487 TaxID=3366182 RepID=UPI003829C9CA
MTQDQKTVGAGVGMPAALHLDAYGREISEAFGDVPYLVGSATRTKQWRDVDVRLILADAEFDALFPAHNHPDKTDGRWSLICAAIAELGRQRTGLPIDFQIQRQTDANRLYDGPRHPLGLYATRGDSPPTAENTTQSDCAECSHTDNRAPRQQP